MQCNWCLTQSDSSFTKTTAVTKYLREIVISTITHIYSVVVLPNDQRAIVVWDKNRGHNSPMIYALCEVNHIHVVIVLMAPLAQPDSGRLSVQACQESYSGRHYWSCGWWVLIAHLLWRWAENFVLDRSIQNRELHLDWMLKAWETITPHVIIKGFATSIILAALENASQ